ncbi:hypothetical protein [Altererythrobacter sp. TH136]|uniref:hypothetical protein n=1 Tax=Altererythrobacter sp. TH136 TaxID=2067415 RepID=UPI001163FB12|nr:hypothetical protein [Altererythrobacter sp. TH136]QDM40958.1 hypothetical protein C0V74_07895 [Altererythrobacter sp. TH136]
MKPIHVLALALMGAPAVSQDREPSREQDQIVVVGEQNQPKKQREEIQEFVRALSTEEWDSPMTRFEKVCPGVRGLSPAQNTAIVARIRAVAAAAGIEVGDKACQPNLRMVVVPDKDEMLQLLKSKHPVLFRDYDGRPVEIVKEDGPATAWHVRERLDRRGNTLEPSESGVTYVDFDGASPRVLALYRPVAMGSMILIEQKGLIGLTTTQIADYAAMRAFTTIYPHRLSRSNAPTILRVMDSRIGDVTPLSLTQWDFAFLKSAYSVPPYSYSSSQRSRIRRAIDKELNADGSRK